MHRVTNLPKVKLSVLLVRDTLDLKEGGVGIGVAFPALMTEYAPFAVESVGRTVSSALVQETSSQANRDHPPPPTQHPLYYDGWTTITCIESVHTVSIPFYVLKVVRWLLSKYRLSSRRMLVILSQSVGHM